MPNDSNNILVNQDLTDQITVNKNLSQEIIVTNTDKVNILLTEHHKIIKKKTEWYSPVSIFITVFTTLLTAKFDEPKFGFSPDLLKAIFIVVCGLTFLYSIYLLWLAVHYRNDGSVQDFIKKIKNQNPS